MKGVHVSMRGFVFRVSALTAASFEMASENALRTSATGSAERPSSSPLFTVFCASADVAPQAPCQGEGGGRQGVRVRDSRAYRGPRGARSSWCATWLVRCWPRRPVRCGGVRSCVALGCDNQGRVTRGGGAVEALRLGVRRNGLHRRKLLGQVFPVHG